MSWIKGKTKQLRSFGLMIGGIFAVFALWPWFIRNEEPPLWAVVLAGLLIIPAVAHPRSLGPDAAAV